MSYFGGKIGKERKLPILVDVDGVVANFCGKVCEIIKETSGREIDTKDIYTDLRVIAKEEWTHEVERRINEEGFAQTLEPFEDGVKAVKELMKDFNVMFLTSPYPDSRHWYHDRYLWLKKHFDITRDDIIFARDKRFVSGITLIDDRPENILDWSSFQQESSILMLQPWNKHLIKNDEDKLFHKKDDSRFYATNNWEQIYNLVQELCNLYL